MKNLTETETPILEKLNEKFAGRFNEFLCLETKEDTMTYDEMQDYCERNRDHETRFCYICAGCSGPSVSNLGKDWALMEERPGITIYRGGSYGSCRFEVQDK